MDIERDTLKDVLQEYEEEYEIEPMQLSQTGSRLYKLQPLFVKLLPLWVILFTYFLVTYIGYNLVTVLSFCGLYAVLLLHAYYMDLLLKGRSL